MSPADLVAGCEGMFVRLARTAARRVGLAGGREAVAEVAAGLRAEAFALARRYDPARGAKFSTFAFGVLQIAALRLAGAEARRGVHLPAYLHATHPPIRPGDLTPAPGVDGPADPPAREPAEAPEFPADFWARVAAAVTPREFEFLSYRFRDNLKWREIAARAGTAQSVPQMAAARALRKLRKALPGLAEYLP